MGGAVAHVIIVSAPVQNIGFWGFSDLVRTLVQDLGTVGMWDSDLGLTKIKTFFCFSLQHSCKDFPVICPGTL